jgi:hypothetical protein
MWAAMLKNEPRRIIFKQHSPNGVILFHYTADLLSSLCEKMMENLRFEDRNCVSFVRNCLRILISSLNADYVPFAAFEIFNDDALERMLLCYVKCLSAIPPSTLSQIPKVEPLLHHLNASIVRRHLEVTATPTVNCSNLLVDVIYTGLTSLQPESVRFALEAMRHLVSCSFTQLSALNRATFLRAVFRVWHVCFTSNQYDCRLCLTHIIAADPESLDLACARLQEMAIPERSADLEQLCQAFIAHLRDLFGKSEGPNIVMKPVTEFIVEARRLVKAPSRVFDA